MTSRMIASCRIAFMASRSRTFNFAQQEVGDETLAARDVARFAAAALLPPVAWAQTQGVSKTEVVVGSIQDLSGPIAAIGTALP